MAKFLILLACCAALFAADQSAAEKELLKIENDWYQAYLHSDAATMNRIEGEDAIVINGSASRSNELEPMRKGRDYSRRSDARKGLAAQLKRSLDRIQVRFFGDVAVINALQTQTGPTRSRKTYYTSIWVKRNGAWEVVNAQYTPVPDPVAAK
jgi:ketosteroid isomerase-like protein